MLHVVGVMPAKNDFIRAGRYDLAKVVERWGGLAGLAEVAGYRAPAGRAQGSAEWRQHIAEVAAETGLGGTQVQARMHTHLIPFRGPVGTLCGSSSPPPLHRFSKCLVSASRSKEVPA